MNPAASNDCLADQGLGSGIPWVNRVYIIDDHPFFTNALSSLINSQADLVVCGSGCDFTDLATLSPDIVLADVNLSSRNNWDLVVNLRRWSRLVPILFVSSLQNPRAEVNLKWLEPCSFVEKTKDPSDIIRSIRQLFAKARLFQSAPPSVESITKP